MSVSVAEMFYSIQGEGHWAGTPMAFLRLAGCDLWNGREADREKGAGACAEFCDANFLPVGGKAEEKDVAASLRKLVAEVQQSSAPPCQRVCVTGGEPTLQWSRALAEALRSAGFTYIHMETNGGRLTDLPGVTWVTMSPKRSAKTGEWRIHPLVRPHEVKVVHSSEWQPVEAGDLVSLFEAYSGRMLDADHFYLQPCTESKNGNDQTTMANLAHCARAVMRDPRWKLSLQTNKIAKLP